LSALTNRSPSTIARFTPAAPSVACPDRSDFVPQPLGSNITATSPAEKIAVRNLDEHANGAFILGFLPIDEAKVQAFRFLSSKHHLLSSAIRDTLLLAKTQSVY
jgi:hypothetical protein